MWDEALRSLLALKVCVSMKHQENEEIYYQPHNELIKVMGLEPCFPDLQRVEVSRNIKSLVPSPPS